MNDGKGAVETSHKKASRFGVGCDGEWWKLPEAATCIMRAVQIWPLRLDLTSNEASSKRGCRLDLRWEMGGRGGRGMGVYARGGWGTWGGCIMRAVQIWPLRLEHRSIEASLTNSGKNVLGGVDHLHVAAAPPAFPVEALGDGVEGAEHHVIVLVTQLPQYLSRCCILQMTALTHCTAPGRQDRFPV